MRRLRVRLWHWMFQAATRLSNVALTRACRACGCPGCTALIRLADALRGGGLAVPTVDGRMHHDARIN